MNLTKKIFRIFLYLFILQIVCLLLASIFFYPSTNQSLPHRMVESLIKVDTTILEGIGLQNEIRNFTARDLLAYRLLELNGLDSSTYVESTNLKKLIPSHNLTDCSEYDSGIICYRANGTVAVGLVPVVLEKVTKGYLKLERSLLITEKINKKVIYTVLMTILVIFIINAISLFFIWWKFLKPETIKLLNVFAKEIEDPTIETQEFKLIQNTFLRALAKAKKMESEKNKLETHLEKINLATLVAHDIRSPLETLKSVRNELFSLSEETQEIIKLCIRRLEEISSNLLNEHRKEKTFIFLEPINISNIVKDIVAEKTIEYRHLSSARIILEDSTLAIDTSHLEPNIFKSLISNLINNAIECLKDYSGEVKIKLSEDSIYNVIEITDTGSGIPEHIIPNLFKKGFSTKKEGNGLGLYHARKEIEFIRGFITFDSRVGSGTTFRIRLPKTKVYKLTTEIDLSKYQDIIILDDEDTIHHLWKKKLKGTKFNVRYYHTPDLLLQDYSSLPKTILFLSDFDLNNKQNGIDIISKLNHFEHSYIVSSRDQDYELLEKCSRLGIHFISKMKFSELEIIT